MDNIIYILINEAMPGYVKIGQTSNLEKRIRSLDNTSSPLPFECFYACTVENVNEVEKRIHDAFEDHRTRSSREFFEIAPERVVSILKLVEIKQVTPGRDYVETKEDQTALEKARKIRSRFNFKMVDISPQTILNFTRDENITCTVVDNKKVDFNGKTTSLSDAAQKALNVTWPVQGPLYWKFEGETLDERRRRLESEE